MAKIAYVEGELVIRNGKTSEIEFYEEKIILTGSLPDIDPIGHARMVVKGGLITDILRRKVKNFKTVRTCAVIKLEDTDQEPEADEMQIALLEAIKLGCVPDNIDNYKRPDYKLKALQKAVVSHHERIKRHKVKHSNVEDQGFVD